MKTSSGYGFVKQPDGSYNYQGATEHDLTLMRASVSPKVQVKAAGGVRDLGGTRGGATAAAAKPRKNPAPLQTSPPARSAAADIEAAPPSPTPQHIQRARDTKGRAQVQHRRLQLPMAEHFLKIASRSTRGMCVAKLCRNTCGVTTLATPARRAAARTAF